MVREASKDDLTQLLQLYRFLHDEDIPCDNLRLSEVWEAIMADKTALIQWL